MPAQTPLRLRLHTDSPPAFTETSHKAPLYAQYYLLNRSRAEAVTRDALHLIAEMRAGGDHLQQDGLNRRWQDGRQSVWLQNEQGSS